MIYGRDGENVAGSGEREKQAAVRAQHDRRMGAGIGWIVGTGAENGAANVENDVGGVEGDEGEDEGRGKEIGSGKSEKNALNNAGPLSGTAGFRFGLAGSVPIREHPRVLPFTDGANGSSCHRSCAAMANHAGLRLSRIKPSPSVYNEHSKKKKVAFSRPW